MMPGLSKETQGLLWGLLAVASFSVTLPATRSAVAYLDVGFVVLGRAIGAGLLAAAILWLTKQPWPERRDVMVLLAIAAGVVVGFPFFTSYAMTTVSASRGAVVIGLLPLSTAIAGVLFAGERPSFGFWVASIAATCVLLAYVLDGSSASFQIGDLALIGAVVSAAVGYALGGRLAVRIGGWQVICWALVVAMPMLLAVAFVRYGTLARAGVAFIPWSAWLGFGYVTLVSQLLGFFAWYHGLALGGIARVSQTQLLQLFMTLCASAVLLGERLDARTVVCGIAVVVIAAVGTRLRARQQDTAAANAAVTGATL
jgi:drug/metabolite transporter (DMT)-like permease